MVVLQSKLLDCLPFEGLLFTIQVTCFLPRKNYLDVYYENYFVVYHVNDLVVSSFADVFLDESQLGQKLVPLSPADEGGRVHHSSVADDQTVLEESKERKIQIEQSINKHNKKFNNNFH